LGVKLYFDLTTDRIKKLVGCKNGTASSITMQSMVGLWLRAAAVDEKVRCIFLFFLWRFWITRYTRVYHSRLWYSLQFITV